MSYQSEMVLIKSIRDYVESKLNVVINTVTETCEQMRMMTEGEWTDERGLMQGYIDKDGNVAFYEKDAVIEKWVIRFEVYKALDKTITLILYGVAGANMLR